MKLKLLKHYSVYFKWEMHKIGNFNYFPLKNILWLREFTRDAIKTFRVSLFQRITVGFPYLDF